MPASSYSDFLLGAQTQRATGTKTVLSLTGRPKTTSHVWFLILEMGVGHAVSVKYTLYSKDMVGKECKLSH